MADSVFPGVGVGVEVAVVEAPFTVVVVVVAAVVVVVVGTTNDAVALEDSISTTASPSLPPSSLDVC